MKRATWLAILVAVAMPMTTCWAQEQPLICFGNEPFWALDLTETGKARFSTPDAPAPDSPAMDYLGAANTLLPRKESVWRGQGSNPDSGDLVAFIREGSCSDSMSDALHPYSANVSLPDGRHYAGCCRLPEPTVSATALSATLEQTAWRLTGLPGQTLAADQGQETVTVNFEGTRVHGFSGCNQFTGSFTFDGERLILGTLGGTMMACPEPGMSVERRFLAAFSGAFDARFTANALTLTPINGGDALRFEREPVAPLEDVQWEVTGYNNGRQAVVSPKRGTRMTLMFEDGQVAGSSGCNRFHGSFALQGKTLAIQPLAVTRKACEDATMSQEREFLNALESAATWDIVRGTLHLHRTDGERVLTASQKE